MKKVLVIGSSGAGKSTFARRLGKITGIEVIHLDKLHWKPNWIEPPKEEWRVIVENAVKSDSWILDGNFSSTMKIRVAACDTIVFLEMPRIVCIWRVLKRIVVYRKGSRPDMAEGCNEKFDWEFIKWIWNYPKQSKPKIESILEQYRNEKTIVYLKSNREIESFLCKIKSI
jgi:adenylate kinase family enzyme